MKHLSLKHVYLIVRNKDTKKTVRLMFYNVNAALVYINNIPSADYADITEIKMEID